MPTEKESERSTSDGDVVPRRAVSPSKQLSEILASELRERVLTGALASGTYLRAQHVAADFGVSATPVREALFVLKEEGFLEQHPRRGFVVRPISESDIVDMFWLQASISGELAARAAEDITDEDIDKLRIAHHRFSSAVAGHDLTAAVQSNREFHVRIDRTARSPKLRYISAIAARYTPIQLFHSGDHFLANAVEEHARIVEAFESRDPEMARRELTEHVLVAGRYAAELFSIGRSGHGR